MAVILEGAASRAANTFADARRLALRLHNERHPDALAALDVALALDEIACEAHRAAELAAECADLAGKVAPLW